MLVLLPSSWYNALFKNQSRIFEAPTFFFEASLGNVCAGGINESGGLQTRIMRSKL